MPRQRGEPNLFDEYGKDYLLKLYIYVDPMNVTNNEVYPNVNDGHYLKIFLAKIEHNLKEVVVSNNPSTNKGQNVYFHSSEGLPISLSIESSLVLIIRCKHEILHKFNIPIESVTEWKIVNGIKHGAFKHGFGLKAKYLDNYRNANCVVYYPPREGFSINSRSKPTTSEIKINLKVNIANKEIIENLRRKNSSNYSNGIEISNYCDREFLLTLHLRQDKGFLKKRFYEVLFLSYKEILNQDKESENITDLTQVIDKDKSLANFSCSCSHITDSNKIIYVISNKSKQSCKLCNPMVTFELPQFDTNSKLKIDIDTDRLFTSEYITISDNYHSYVKNGNYKNEGKNFIVFAVKCDYELLEFRFINCPSIMVFQTFWEVTAGSILYSNTGHSITYWTSSEKERSKSPVTLSLYKRDIFNESKNIESSHLLDQKKIWLLRRMIFGG